MKYCYYCGAQLEDDDIFCMSCGRPQDGDDIDDVNEANSFDKNKYQIEETNIENNKAQIDVKFNDIPGFVEYSDAQIHCGNQINKNIAFNNINKPTPNISRDNSQGTEKDANGNIKAVVTVGIIVLCVCAIAFVGWSIFSGQRNDVDSNADDYECEYSDEYSDEYADGEDLDYDVDYSDCIFPYSSEDYISESDAAYLSDDELQEAINELYARHGRIFDDEEVQEYFSTKSWYVPVAKGIEKEDFNEYEEYNWEILTEERNLRAPEDEE